MSNLRAPDWLIVHPQVELCAFQLLSPVKSNSPFSPPKCEKTSWTVNNVWEGKPSNLFMPEACSFNTCASCRICITASYQRESVCCVWSKINLYYICSNMSVIKFLKDRRKAVIWWGFSGWRVCPSCLLDFAVQVHVKWEKAVLWSLIKWHSWYLFHWVCSLTAT